MDDYYNNDYLQHFGIKGMKWGVRRYQNKDGSLTNAGKKRRRSEPHEDYQRAHGKKSVKQMSDKELREVNNRLEMERKYAQFTKKTSKGKKVVNTLIATAGTIAAAETAYKTYKRIGNKAINAIGDYLLDEVAKAF